MTPPSWPDLIRLRLNWGRDRAVTLGALAEDIGISRRVVEQAVEASRKGGAPIISGPTGIWLSADPGELRACADALARRLVTQYQTVRALRRTARRFEGVEQLGMFDAA